MQYEPNLKILIFGICTNVDIPILVILGPFGPSLLSPLGEAVGTSAGQPDYQHEMPANTLLATLDAAPSCPILKLKLKRVPACLPFSGM